MLKYEHLLGIPFNWDTDNCYTLLRRFYADNFGIELTDYACPTDWFETNMDLYAKLASTEGFSIVHDHPRDWRPGDVILMAIPGEGKVSSTGNHVAIVLDNGNILHHLVGQLSTVTRYGGLFRNTTVGVYRHKDVPADAAPESLVDIRTVLPPHVQQRLSEIEGTNQQASEEAVPRA